MCLSGSERVDECVSVGVRESTNVSQWEGVSRRMCLSGSERVDECVSVGLRESTNVSQWE